MGMRVPHGSHFLESLLVVFLEKSTGTLYTEYCMWVMWAKVSWYSRWYWKDLMNFYVVETSPANKNLCKWTSCCSLGHFERTQRSVAKKHLGSRWEDRESSKTAPETYEHVWTTHPPLHAKEILDEVAAEIWSLRSGIALLPVTGKLGSEELGRRGLNVASVEHLQGVQARGWASVRCSWKNSECVFFECFLICGEGGEVSFLRGWTIDKHGILDYFSHVLRVTMEARDPDLASHLLLQAKLHLVLLVEIQPP